MIITCPKCKISYQVDDNLISDEGKKVHCSNCSEVWVVNKNDNSDIANTQPVSDIKEELKENKKSKKNKIEAKDSVKLDEVSKADVEFKPLNNEPIIDPIVFKDEKKEAKKTKEISIDDIDEMFSSFSIRKEKALSENEAKKVKKEINLAPFFNAIFFILTFFIVVAFSLYYWRYEVVQTYPEAKRIYNKFGVNPTYFAQGLEFEDVSKLEYEDGFYPQIIVTGFIVNNSKEIKTIPTIQVSFLGENKNILGNIRYNLTDSIIKPNEKVPFDVSLDKTDDVIKYIKVTFTK